MLIEIHMIQNHSPANLNRDDLGAPKTCYFGGYLRSRISSQCLKRSIRLSEQFKDLMGGKRTRRLIELAIEEAKEVNIDRAIAADVMKSLGFPSKPLKKSKGTEGNEAEANENDDAKEGKSLIYFSKEIVSEVARLFSEARKGGEEVTARRIAELIAERTAVPDMALCGRMLEPSSPGKSVWKDIEDKRTVEAALQASHAISTHEARPEVDYYVAADDVKGSDHGAGYVDEAMFNSACFYKYFSINWEQLQANLKGQVELAGHTVGAFLRGAAQTTPSGKQNSFAAHNCPDGILVEFKNSPVCYANAFVKPVRVGERDLVGQSVAELATYVHQLENGFGGPSARLWFSPGGRYALSYVKDNQEQQLTERNFMNFDEFVKAVIQQLGLDWDDVQKVKL